MRPRWNLRKGSWRELRERPTTNFTAFALAISLLPASVAGVLKQRGVDDPWSGMRFATVSAYRAVDSAYEPDLASRLGAASRASIATAIATARDDAMLPGGLAYLADDGLRLQRVDPAEAATLRAENQRFETGVRERCGDAPTATTLAACDPVAVYDLIRADLDAAARTRIERAGLNYATITGEHQEPDGAPTTRDLLLLSRQQQRDPVEEMRLRGARSRLDALVRAFTQARAHEHRYADEMRAYAHRPRDATLYGTWEYRPDLVDWAGARDAGKRNPHLVILTHPARGTLVWQFYRGTERGFLIAPDGSVGEYTP